MSRPSKKLPTRFVQKVAHGNPFVGVGSHCATPYRADAPAIPPTAMAATTPARLSGTTASVGVRDHHAVGQAMHGAGYGPDVELGDLQRLMAATYGEQDRARGVPATVAWLTEELGDVLAWLASLAEQLGLSLDDAVARYAHGCPRCGEAPCVCVA